MFETPMPNDALTYPPSVGRLLNFATKAANDISEKRLAAHGLTLSQWVLLSAVWRQDGLTVGQLAAYCCTSEPTISSLIGRMERKELVERELDPADRRQVRVYVTSKGKSLSHLAKFYEQINDILVDGFSAQERQTFLSMIERVIANAGADGGSQETDNNS